MRENHPLEYERIIAAYDYVQQLSGKPAAPVGSPE
jgi:hypothetical protein